MPPTKFLVPKGTKSSRREHEQGPSNAVVLRSTKSTEPHQSTSRALVLRRAAYGTGEVALSSKISGQEKLSLLAEEMMTTAIRPPFRMDELLKIAESQLGVHLDEIDGLKDPGSFYEDIMAMVEAMPESAPDSTGVRRPPIHDPRWIAGTVGCKIHNVYLLAGSWRIVRNILRDLEAIGLVDSDVRGQLRTNQVMREQYLVLYNIVTMLARMGQQRVANLAAVSSHYAPYFVQRKSAGIDAVMEFDYHGNNRRKIREAHKSFIDSILLELILPESQYPPYILMALLHNAVEECKKEEKRFSQALWDAVGDFSVTVQVLDFLEGPLLGKEGEAWIIGSPLSQEYTEFLEVQALSDKASQNVESWKKFLTPLVNTKKKLVLDQLWLQINKSYQQVSGIGVDALWSLQSDLQPSPQWSTYFVPGLEVEDRDPHKDALVLHKGSKKPMGMVKNHRQIANGSDDSDMPELLTVSDSSDDGDPIELTSDDEVSEGDSESDYNPAEDELLQEMLQEALDDALDHDLLDLDSENLAAQEKKSSNPFTRMLATLKDRYFSANPALRANERSLNPFKSRPEGIRPKTTTSQTPTTKPSQKVGTAGGKSGHARVSDSDLPALEPIKLPQPKAKFKPKFAPSKKAPYQPVSSEEELPPLVPLGPPAPPRMIQKPTIEEVEDEEADIQAHKKKKKKKKKSKKSQDMPASPQQTQLQESQPEASPPPPVPSNAPKESPGKQPNVRTLPRNETAMDVNFSRVSLRLPQDTTAQSARSYMQSENLMMEKTKVKSRPAFAGSFFKSNKDSKKPDDQGEKKSSLLGSMKEKIRLGKRATNLMKRLITPSDGKNSMKWEDFLKVMKAMGFSYDSSTAGSSVRFDPPDPRDRPITFHKPHPDPTLRRQHLRKFGGRLKRRYGWTPEQFANFGIKQDDDVDDVDDDEE